MILRPRIIDPEEANKSEVLVPIRIEFDVDHHKMREAFIWNLNGVLRSQQSILMATHTSKFVDPVITPEIFAQSLVDDYNLSSNYHNVIAKSIQEQLADFHGQSFSLTDPDGVHEERRATLNGALNESEARWWAKWRRKVKKEARRALEEADVLKGERRRKSGLNKREGTRQHGGLRKRRKTAAGEVKKEAKDNDTDVLADDEWDIGTVKESIDDEDDEWKSLGLEEIKVDEQNMHEEMRILIKVCFLF